MHRVLLQVIVLIACSIVISFKLNSTLETYLDSQFQQEQSGTELAKDLRTGEVQLSTEQLADLIEVRSARTLEIHVPKLFVNISTVIVLSMPLIYLFGYLAGRRNYKKRSLEKTLLKAEGQD